MRKNGALLEMDFPANAPAPCGSVPGLLRTGLGRSPLEVWSADVYVAVFDSESTVRSIRPDHSLLSHLDLRAVIVGGRSQSPNSTEHGEGIWTVGTCVRAKGALGKWGRKVDSRRLERNRDGNRSIVSVGND